MRCSSVFVCLRVCVFKGVCALETRRRLITSSSFAVGWLHLDGPVHLEKEREREREKKRREIPG